MTLLAQISFGKLLIGSKRPRSRHAAAFLKGTYDIISESVKRCHGPMSGADKGGMHDVRFAAASLGASLRGNWHWWEQM
jgi:hypothetical protein